VEARTLSPVTKRRKRTGMKMVRIFRSQITVLGIGLMAVTGIPFLLHNVRSPERI
jgi:hypothetical protein